MRALVTDHRRPDDWATQLCLREFAALGPTRPWFTTVPTSSPHFQRRGCGCLCRDGLGRRRWLNVMWADCRNGSRFGTRETHEVPEGEA